MSSLKQELEIRQFQKSPRARTKNLSIMLLAGLFLISILFVSRTGMAATYKELMDQAHGEAKPAEQKKAEENPVMVQYEVGQTTNFYTDSSMDSFDEQDQESEWDSWDENN